MQITPMTDAMAATTEKLPAPMLRATAVNAGNKLCGNEIGRALTIQNLILFISKSVSAAKLMKLTNFAVHVEIN